MAYHYLNEKNEYSNRVNIVVIVSYPQQWHWVLSAEYAINQKKLNLDPLVLDFSKGELSLPKKSWLYLSKTKKLQKEIRNLFREYGITYIKVRYSIKDQIKAMISVARHKFPLVIDDSKVEYRTIYPSLVDMLNAAEIEFRKHRFTVRKELFKALLMRQYLENSICKRAKKIVTVNGRFTKNYEVKSLSEKEGISTIFLEFGANRNRIEEYTISPHSSLEHQFKMNELWKGDEEQIRVAKNFFLELLDFDRFAGLSWTSQMVTGQLPEIAENKKLCVFFTSNQREFAGVGDQLSSDFFSNQFEGFNSLLNELEIAGNWHIVVRRHPVKSNSWTDFDQKFWKKYSLLPNVQIIEPNSSVDSYALGMRADLVVHFNSSIGIQLIYLGHKSVMTLGPAAWRNLVPETSAQNLLGVKSFLSTPQKNWRPEDVLPWAYYRADFGELLYHFQYQAFDSSWKVL